MAAEKSKTEKIEKFEDVEDHMEGPPPPHVLQAQELVISLRTQADRYDQLLANLLQKPLEDVQDNKEMILAEFKHRLETGTIAEAYSTNERVPDYPVGNDVVSDSEEDDESGDEQSIPVPKPPQKVKPKVGSKAPVVEDSDEEDEEDEDDEEDGEEEEATPSPKKTTPLKRAAPESDDEEDEDEEESDEEEEEKPAQKPVKRRK